MVQQKGNRVNHLASDTITTLLSRCNKKAPETGLFCFWWLLIVFDWMPRGDAILFKISYFCGTLLIKNLSPCYCETL